MAMDSGNYAPTGASYGEFTIMQMSGTPTAKASSFQKEDFVAKYALSNRTLTARELAMVPTLPDWYIIPKEVVRVCEHAKVTTASSQPMRNFLFRGEAGTGKTMGSPTWLDSLFLIPTAFMAVLLSRISRRSPTSPCIRPVSI